MGNWLSPSLVLLAVGLYGGLHSFLASFFSKAWARQKFGPAADRYYRLVFNLVGLVTLLPVLALVLFLPDQPLYRFPTPWDWLGYALQAGGVVMLVAGVLHTDAWAFLGLRQLTTADPTAPERLVVHGLYSWVRHPLYTAGLLFMWGTPAMSANLFAAYLGLSIYLYIGAVFEERKLLRVFGQEYAAYRARVPMLIPGIKFGAKP